MAVDHDPGKAFPRQLSQPFPMIALLAHYDGSEQQNSCLTRQGKQLIDDLLERLRLDLSSTPNTGRLADAREKQPQIVVDLGNGPHSRTGSVNSGFLLDGDGGRKAVDRVHIGPFHLL